MRHIPVLLAAALCTASFANAENAACKDQAPCCSTQANASELPQSTGKVTVTYFTTNARCKTCLKIEALTRKVVEERFASELASGRLEFRAINIDLPENRHYADNYQLSFKTVVISSTNADGKEDWARMDAVWQKVGRESEFASYIEGGINKALGK